MALAFTDDQDFLPPGPHAATVAEVEDGLVSAFPTSETRRPIYADWLALREALAALVGIERQWLNGSFATKKLNPNDLDLASFLDSVEIEQLGPEQEQRLSALVSGSSDVAARCDSFLIVEYPPGHPLHHVSTSLIQGFAEVFFGTGPAGPGSKGYVEVSE
jgi:hypothetical protein